MQNALKQESKVVIFQLNLQYCWASPPHPKNKKHINSSTPNLALHNILFISPFLLPKWISSSSLCIHQSWKPADRMTDWLHIYSVRLRDLSLNVLNLKKMIASLSWALSLLQTCHLRCASCQGFSARRSTFIILHMHAHTSSSPLPFPISPFLSPWPSKNVWVSEVEWWMQTDDFLVLII